MNYSLTLNGNINIDLSKISLNKKESFQLKYIDEITTLFENEKELKEYLFLKEVIVEEDLNKSISISYGKKNKRYIPLIYKEDKEILDKIKGLSDEVKEYFESQKRNAYNDFSYSLIMGDYKNIENHFESFKTFAGNYNFLRALQEYVSNNPKQNFSINDITIYINERNVDRKSKFLHIALFEVFRRIFYNYNEEDKELEFNYKGFRDFCVFYCEYKKNLDIKKSNKISKEILDVNLDDFIEPEFPPNSEEESKFLKYLDELEEKTNYPIEEHDHYRR